MEGLYWEYGSMVLVGYIVIWFLWGYLLEFWIGGYIVDIIYFWLCLLYKGRLFFGVFLLKNKVI